MHRSLALAAAALAGAATLASAGCHVHGAHLRHRRAIHRFLFYPHIHVYYSPVDRCYWHRHDGGWVRVHTLPSTIVLDSSESVEMEMEHQEPWRDYDVHVRKHPPGRYKRTLAPGRAGTAPGQGGDGPPGRTGTAPGHLKKPEHPGKGKAKGHDKDRGPGKPEHPGKGHGKGKGRR